MPYPPNRATSLMFKDDYVRAVRAYQRQEVARAEVLIEKSDVEHCIDNLMSDEDYLQEFFDYISNASAAELSFDVRVFERTISDLPLLN
jgi:hypothetical protein